MISVLTIFAEGDCCALALAGKSTTTMYVSSCLLENKWQSTINWITSYTATMHFILHGGGSHTHIHTPNIAKRISPLYVSVWVVRWCSTPQGTKNNVVSFKLNYLWKKISSWLNSTNITILLEHLLTEYSAIFVLVICTLFQVLHISL